MEGGKKSRRGFASMSPERRREIAALGGKSIPAEKRTFSKDRDLAKRAGRAGGVATPGQKRTFATNRELAAAAGRKGGAAGQASKERTDFSSKVRTASATREAQKT
jgi:general stress protein YciG